MRQEQQKRDTKEANHFDVQEDVGPLSAFYTWDGNNSPFMVALSYHVGLSGEP